jgi:hypothetical protein
MAAGTGLGEIGKITGGPVGEPAVDHDHLLKGSGFMLVGQRTESATPGPATTPPGGRTESGSPTTVNNAVTANPEANANANATAGVVNNVRPEGGAGGAGGTGIGGNATQNQSESLVNSNKTSYFGAPVVGASSWALPNCGEGFGIGAGAGLFALNLSKTSINKECLATNKFLALVDNANKGAINDAQAGLQAFQLLMEERARGIMSAGQFDQTKDLLLARFGRDSLVNALKMEEAAVQGVQQGLHIDTSNVDQRYAGLDFNAGPDNYAPGVQANGQSVIYNELNQYGVPGTKRPAHPAQHPARPKGHVGTCMIDGKPVRVWVPDQQ